MEQIISVLTAFPATEHKVQTLSFRQTVIIIYNIYKNILRNFSKYVLI